MFPNIAASPTGHRPPLGHHFRHKIVRLAVVALFLQSFYILSANAKSAERPNIVLIMADDLGYETIGANGGSSYKTPILDKLAATGARFEHCYAQPLCTPTRAQLMTGIYNVRNYVNFGTLDRKQTTFAHLLKNAGYATCIAGKWQLGNQPDSAQHFGFDRSCLWHHTRRPSRYPNPGLEINGKEKDFSNGAYGPDVAVDFICDFITEHQKEPFFVYYPMILTHCPFEPTPDSPDWDPNSKGSKTYKGNAKYFGDMVTYMDKTIGKIITKLDDLGIRDNTLVIFLGDNGTDKPVVSTMNGREVAGGKGMMTDAGTRVPLIVSWPAQMTKPVVSDDLVDTTDFLPTICEAAGVAVPEKLHIDGRSFLPQLKGEKGNPREWIYCWYSRSGKSNQAQIFARNQQYKLYSTGKFYDVTNDVLEKKPMQDLNDQAKAAQAKLQSALDLYQDARPQHLAGQPKKKNKNMKKEKTQT